MTCTDGLARPARWRQSQWVDRSHLSKIWCLSSTGGLRAPHTGTSTDSQFFAHALREHGVDRSSAFDDDCINDPKNPWRWANSLGHGAHQILRERCACGRNARNMCTERVRVGPQFGHGEMVGILVKVLLSRRLLEDAGPADFRVELDLPLSTTPPGHELSF